MTDKAIDENKAADQTSADEVSLADTQEFLKGETVNMTPDQLGAELEKLYGRFICAHAFDYHDGRKVFVMEHERIYVVRSYNPNLADDLKGVQVNYTRETMCALNLLYVTPRTPARLLEDERLFLAALTDDSRAAWDRVAAPLIEQRDGVLEVFTEIASYWQVSGSSKGAVRECAPMLAALLDRLAEMAPKGGTDAAS